MRNAGSDAREQIILIFVSLFLVFSDLYAVFICYFLHGFQYDFPIVPLLPLTVNRGTNEKREFTHTILLLPLRYIVQCKIDEI